MRQRKETWILTFAGTTQAMQMEQYARAHGLPGRMIPIPREITAGCGLSWKAAPEEGKEILAALQTAGLAYEAEYRVLLSRGEVEMEEKEEVLRQELRYDMRLRVSRTDHAFGPGVAELMEHVEATGSLSKGCRCMQMAYSKGWKILKRAEEDLGIPLVQGNRGGSNGGQTVLTPEGKEFLKRYRKFEQEVRAGADASFQKWFGTAEK